MNSETEISGSNAALWSKTKQGLRQYLETGVWHMNKYHRGKTIQGPTGQTTRKRAQTFMTNYLARLDRGLDPSRARADEVETFAKKEPVIVIDGTLLVPNPNTGLLESFTMDQAIKRLSETILEKEKSGEITSVRSIIYREECIEAVIRLWRSAYGGEFGQRQAGSFTTDELEEFRRKTLSSFSASRYNGMMQNLRALFDEAKSAKAIRENPCREREFKFKTLQATYKDLEDLLTDENYAILFAELAETDGEHVSRSVEFLTLCGARIECARQVLKTDVDLKGGTLTLRKQLIKGGNKRGAKDIVIPLFPELRHCVEALLKMEQRGEYLMACADFRRHLDRATKKLNLPHQHPHLFRHIFGTKLVSPENQALISIADAAELMGHRDKGRTMLAVYVHTSIRLRQAGLKLVMRRAV